MIYVGTLFAIIIPVNKRAIKAGTNYKNFFLFFANTTSIVSPLNGMKKLLFISMQLV